jgi:glycosyltransferase involved in cell wall biosynthesis
MLSLIVPAHDEEPLIAATVHALRAAAESTGEPFEILVVDDASTDATARRAHEAGAAVVPVSLRHIAAVRNAGAAAARGDVFVFADADTIVSPAALRDALGAVRAGAVGGGAWTVTFDGHVPWAARLGVWLTLNAFRVTGMAFGCFLFCTREAFTAVGGFDTSLFAAEEVRFSRSLARLGRFELVQGPVVTSGRKFRTFGVLEVARAAVAASFRGTAALRSRDHLPLWYGRRRHEARHDAGGRRPSS